MKKKKTKCKYCGTEDILDINNVCEQCKYELRCIQARSEEG